MLEVVVFSLFVGSVGFQTVLLGGWKIQQQRRLEQECVEEEEVLTRYDSQEYKISTEATPEIPSSNSYPFMPMSPATQSPVQQNGSAPTEEDNAKDPRLTGWEFKIVRANRDVFRNPAVLQRLCKEEAESGWILLEKLDDRRIRFRRPMALREILKPEFLHHDPYRSCYGSSTNLGTWLFAIAFLTISISSAYLGYALVKTTLATSQAAPPSPATVSFPELPSPKESPSK
ncbi:hypothetical protein BST81_09695 [Leptolyngbya sp. 'hensonii']|uniref:hypothetical protein n=1 Tax=Leptolyngbya sp. 'hensonii' TaxID=1922337 RepID=UPI00094FDE58|nr:hypothetical protein [Leptolyngbya sp. 'hensonii']OLP18558.1 hypothetical protein BST81_09695 [Leptolyngbya sp. 'hensonii']